MADKDKNDNVDNKKMQKEQMLEKKAVKMLIEEYGYSKSQIKTGYRISKIQIDDVPRMLDVVVFAKEDVKQKTPYIVIETKTSLLLPLNKYQLEEIINATNASFGMLYDGDKKLCYAKLPTRQLETLQRLASETKTTLTSFDEGTKIIPIADIPARTGYRTQKSKKEQLAVPVPAI